MQIVLDVIGGFRIEEEARGHDLDVELKNGLKQLAGDCEDVLHDVEELLDERRASARGSKMARMRWLAMQKKSNTHQVDGFDESFGCIEQSITWASLLG
jgi:hypothetical protein